MSLSYKPDSGAFPDSFWGPAFLSNRDITGQAPIDKVPWTGVSITSACFADGVYDDLRFQKCLSNLLATEYRRTILDVYWDSTNTRFGLCPVKLPRYAPSTSTISQATSLGVFVTQNVSSTAISNTTATPQNRLLARQDLSSGVTVLANTTTSASVNANANANATTTATATYSTVTGEGGRYLIAIGPYQCSVDLTLQSVVSLYESYMRTTSDPVRARLQFLEFNLHAASEPDNPVGPALNLSANQLPDSDDRIAAQFDGDIGRELYTPAMLRSERRNLNVSWFGVRQEFELPILEYYNVYNDSNHNIGTEDGWPNEHFLLFSETARLILAWNSIDDQMSGYDFDSEADKIFPINYLEIDRPISSSGTGVIESGCFYDAADTNVASVNNSWAATILNQPNLEQQGNLIDNITACGIGPIVNGTLGGSSADESYGPYQVVAQQAIFGWAVTEPRNVSQSDPDVDADQYRCALMVSDDAYRGHWRVADCQDKYRAACRVAHQPFRWRLSSVAVPYGSGPNACKNDDNEFGTPRTGLENTYLYNQILSEARSNDDNNFRQGVWLNLNSLDVMDCWVTTGPNGTCEYEKQAEEQHSREVLIPTIAALIVIILTVLVILVKCNANRRSSRARRTGPGGWEYEGVPT